MADATPAQIVDLMVGQKVDRLYPRSTRSPGEVVLSAEGLELRRGEVLGLAGLIGAGRTELLRRIFGLDPGATTPAASWRRGIGFVSEDRKNEGLALGLSIADNLTLSKLDRIVLPSRQSSATRRWIDALAIRCRDAFQSAADLSGGNQQKIALARLLHHGVSTSRRAASTSAPRPRSTSSSTISSRRERRCSWSRATPRSCSAPATASR